jgi:hypothetical protein
LIIRVKINHAQNIALAAAHHYALSELQRVGVLDVYTIDHAAYSGKQTRHTSKDVQRLGNQEQILSG